MTTLLQLGGNTPVYIVPTPLALKQFWLMHMRQKQYETYLHLIRGKL